MFLSSSSVVCAYQLSVVVSGLLIEPDVGLTEVVAVVVESMAEAAGEMAEVMEVVVETVVVEIETNTVHISAGTVAPHLTRTHHNKY